MAIYGWPSQGRAGSGQFLMGMENHKFSVQVAAHGHRAIEEVLRIA